MIEGGSRQPAEPGHGGRLGGRGLVVHLRVGRDQLVLLLQPLPVRLAWPLGHLFNKCKWGMVAAVDLIEEGIRFILLLHRCVVLDITPDVVE